MKKRILAGVFALGLATAAFTGCGSSDTADVVVKGNIYTGDKDGSVAQAAAVKDGKYQYVGDEEGVESYIGKDTQVIETGGGMAMPSFMESHAHGHQGGVGNLFEVNLYDDTSMEAYQKSIRAFVKEHPDMKFINGAGWINGYCPNGGPTTKLLDEACKDIPVVLVSGDHHSYWVNSKALEMTGVTKATKDVEGGVIERDAQGNPTGTFREKAGALVEAIIPEYSVEQYKEGILNYQNEVKGYGVTAYFEPMVNLVEGSNLLKAYNQLDDEGKLVLRVYGGYKIVANNDPMKELEKAAKLAEESKGGDFEVTTIKLLIDGVIEGKTAYLLDGYADDPGYKGEILWKQDELNKVCAKADELGLQLHAHAIGDGAVQMSVNAYQYVQDKNGDKDRRAAITHLQVVNEKDIKRMADLNTIAVTNPYWFYKEPGYFQELELPYLGKDRANKEYPMKDFFDAGITVTAASDYPVTMPAVPLEAIQAAVTRCNLEGDKSTLLGAHQKVTVEQMIQAATRNGAFLNYAEDIYGTVERGKSADLIVLDQDITKIDAKKIGSVKVQKTLLKGKTIYEAK